MHDRTDHDLHAGNPTLCRYVFNVGFLLIVRLLYSLRLLVCPISLPNMSTLYFVINIHQQEYLTTAATKFNDAKSSKIFILHSVPAAGESTGYAACKAHLPLCADRSKENTACRIHACSPDRLPLLIQLLSIRFLKYGNPCTTRG